MRVGVGCHLTPEGACLPCWFQAIELTGFGGIIVVK